MNQEHQLEQTQGGWSCQLCEVTWSEPPHSSCPGVKLYRYTAIPWDSLSTSTQLKQRKLKPAPNARAAGCYFRLKDGEYIYLYRVDEAIPRRVPSEKQRQAVVKMQEGLRLKHTCQRCGFYDRTHGRRRSRYFQGDVSVLIVDGVDRLYCEECRRYTRWSYDRHVIESTLSVWMNEQNKPWLVVDTETTSLLDHSGFQVVEIACIDKTGMVLFHSLVKPNAPITPGARKKHGITDEMLEHAPAFPDIWPTLVDILAQYELWCYGADFDKAAIIRTAERYGLTVPEGVRNPNRWNCLMKEYATYYGMWSDSRKSYKWQELATACQDLGVCVSGYHRAVADAMSALGVIRTLAERGGTYPVPQEQPAYYSGSEYYGENY